MARRLGIVMFVILLISADLVQSQDSPAAVFVEAAVDQAAPFVGQQILYTVQVYEASDRADTAPLYEPPDFEGFWRIDVQPFPFSQTSQQINNRTYIVSEIRTALYATRPGELTIASANIVLPETVFRPEQRVSSNPVRMQAQPLPDGAPDGFNGAVGQFELAATLDRQSVTLGEPVTLRLTVRGTGNVEPLLPPDVPTPEGWQMFANPGVYAAAQDSAGRIVGEKVFEWVFIPNDVGAAQLPTITLVYFDPASLAYRTLETAPTMIEVLPGSVAAQPAVPTVSLLETAGVVPVKPVPAALTAAATRPSWWFWLLWLIAPAGTAASAGWVIRQQRQRRDQVKLRRAAALAMAKTRLQAAAAGPAPQAYHAINTAVWGYFGDKLDGAPQRLNQDDLRRVMTELKIPPEVGKRVLMCLERANEGQYAPMSAVDAQQLVSYTQDTLRLLEAAWEAP